MISSILVLVRKRRLTRRAILTNRSTLQIYFSRRTVQFLHKITIALVQTRSRDQIRPGTPFLRLALTFCHPSVVGSNGVALVRPTSETNFERRYHKM